MRKDNTYVAALAFASVLAGCGGGSDSVGGGAPQTAAVAAKDGETTADGPMPAPASVAPLLFERSAGKENGGVTKPLYLGPVLDVGVGVVTPASIEATLYERSPMPNLSFTSTAIGDIGLLGGQTLFVKVADPVGMFSHGYAWPVAATVPTLGIVFQGKAMQTPGLFTGKLPIWVCLDALCATKLRGMPYELPYRVDVLRGYRTANGESPVTSVELVIRSKFGEIPPVGRLSLIAPERAPFSTLTSSVWYGPGGWGYEDNSRPSSSLTDNGDSAVTLNVALPSPESFSPGLRSTMISVNSSHRVGQNSGPTSMWVTLRHELEENPERPWMFTPSTLLMSLPANSTQSASAEFQATSGRNFGALVYEGLEYLLTPAQEALIPEQDRAVILQISDTPVAQSSQRQSAAAVGCIGREYDQNFNPIYSCLPVGRYAFRLRYRHTVDGVSSTIYYSGQLSITPQ